MNRLGLRTFLPRLFAASPTAAAAAAAPANTTQQVRRMARKAKAVPQGDARVRMIRYFLFHPAHNTPRPLKFGTMRMLRHWTIHRAWLLFKRAERIARERELERQYNKIRDACEELKRTDERLFRNAVSKKEVGTFPIELRIPTDTPPRNGWNHGWRRA